MVVSSRVLDKDTNTYQLLQPYFLKNFGYYCPHLSAETRVHSQDNPSVICGRQSNAMTGFPCSTSVLPVNLHSVLVHHDPQHQGSVQ